MSLFTKITLLLNGLVLIRFSISKILAWPISVKAFIEMAKPLNIDPTFFRLSTGVLISILCLSYFLSFFLVTLKKFQESSSAYIITVFSCLLGIGTMAGALIAEFFLRIEPKWPLVYIALFIIITSIINIVVLQNSLYPKRIKAIWS